MFYANLSSAPNLWSDHLAADTRLRLRDPVVRPQARGDHLRAIILKARQILSSAPKHGAIISADPGDTVPMGLSSAPKHGAIISRLLPTYCHSSLFSIPPPAIQAASVASAGCRTIFADS